MEEEQLIQPPQEVPPQEEPPTEPEPVPLAEDQSAQPRDEDEPMQLINTTAAAQNPSAQTGPAQTAKLRKNRELSYLHTANIINDAAPSNPGPGRPPKIKQLMKQYLASKLAKSALDAQRQSFILPQKRPSLNQMKMPAEIEHMFPNKVKVYEQMRESEEAINAFMKQRLLAAKEDLLQNNSRVKRNMRIMVEVTHSIPSTKHLSSTDWKVRVEGRVQGLQSEEETLKADGNRFLNYIEKIKLEFPGSEDLYPTVDWVKAKSGSGATIDCIEVTRSINKEQKKKLNNSPIKVKLSLSLENNPPRYRISAPLSRILGGIEEATRLQVLGALWQYIKSNRLQDPDNREKILCNQELSEVFYCPIGKERLEFSEIVFRLKDHLTDIPPLELSFDVNVHSPVPKMGQAPTTDTFYYDLTVFEHGGHHKEYIDFLVNCDYDFYSQQAPDDLFAEPSDKTNKLVLNGAALKRREQKYDEKIGASIDAMKRSYKQMQFFNRLSGNVRQSLSSTIIEQNRWLRIMQEEQPSMYEASYETASQTVEHENAQFYQENQSWLLGEIEQYLKKQREEKEAQAEGENGKKQQSESEREDNEY